jgi:predicted secreted acid phosphatase
MISEGELRRACLFSIQIPYITKYVKCEYFDDLQRVSYAAVQYIKTRDPDVVAFDIDETILQNASFYYNTCGLWHPQMQAYYKRLAERDIGGLLPFIHMVHAYAKYKKIPIYFITARSESLREVTELNLATFGLTYDGLYFTRNKNAILEKFSNPIALSDQPEFKCMIALPSLYFV